MENFLSRVTFHESEPFERPFRKAFASFRSYAAFFAGVRELSAAVRWNCELAELITFVGAAEQLIPPCQAEGNVLPAAVPLARKLLEVELLLSHFDADAGDLGAAALSLLEGPDPAALQETLALIGDRLSGLRGSAASLSVRQGPRARGRPAPGLEKLEAVKKWIEACEKREEAA
jgi:hypothetical protein